MAAQTPPKPLKFQPLTHPSAAIGALSHFLIGSLRFRRGLTRINADQNPRKSACISGGRNAWQEAVSILGIAAIAGAQLTQNDYLGNDRAKDDCFAAIPLIS